MLFHNTTSNLLEVKLLSVSNGEQKTNSTSLPVSPGRTVSVRRDDPVTLGWSPVEYTPLWVNKLSVPDGIVVANRAESEIAELLGGPEPPCTSQNQFSAGLPLQVFTALVPPLVAQYHLATDIGDYVGGNRHLDSRINVGIYNDAGFSAHASIEIHCSPGPDFDTFDQPDPLIQTVTLTVPPSSVVQITALNSTTAAPCPISVGAAPYHVVVTSDQPGFSYVSAISNDALPKFPAATSFTF